MTFATTPESHQPPPNGDVAAPRSTEGRLDHIPLVSREQLLASFSLALDLAEGRSKGHALRVSYIATRLAQALNLTEAQRLTCFSAGLLHDIGVAHASVSLAGLGRGYEHEIFAGSPLSSPETLAGKHDPRRMVTVVDAFHEHAFEGATAAASLGLPPQVAEAILCHHERHDGGGFPLGLSGPEIPAPGRVVAAADYAEALLSSSSSPLLARRHLEGGLREQAGRAFHPQVVDALIAITREDDFWLDIHAQSLAPLLVAAAERDPQPMSEDAILHVSSAFADIVDARNSYKRGHSRRVARLARVLAGVMGLSAGHSRAVELAALLHDLGMLRVPGRIIAKPEILTVEEMHILHAHPLESAEIVRTIAAWAPIAAWTAAHHERLDGRGYPEALTADEIPFEARILAVADVYEALTSHRPHRAAFAPARALEAMRAMTGLNIDPSVFLAFERLDPAAWSEAGDA